MRIHIQIKYFQENDVIVALCPELQVSSFGDTIVEAERSIKEALELFFEGCKELGTLSEVLEESGFVMIGNEWISRKPIGSTETTLQLFEEPKFYA